MAQVVLCPSAGSGGKRRAQPVPSIQYRGIDGTELPLFASLEDTSKRVLPYFESVIMPDVKQGDRVLVAAHGNSIRALVKTLDGLSDEEITEVNIPPASRSFTNSTKTVG